MKIKLYLEIVYAMVFALIVNTFVYFSFSNVYSSTSINYENFIEQYTNGIYQYRYLSTFLLLKIHDLVSSLNLGTYFKLFLWNDNGEKNMLLSYYIVNSIFLCLFSGGVIYIFRDKTQRERLLLMSSLVFTIIISQFILVPYDVSSYFFILLFFHWFSKYLKTNKTEHFALSILILIISTFNRESSALSLSLAGSLLYFQNGLSKKTIIPIFTLAGVFIATYVGMRLYFGSFTTNDGNLLMENLTKLKNYLGMFFSLIFLSFTLLISKKEDRQVIILFHILSLPYILMCFYTGIVYEIRLYIPLFISSILIGDFSIKTKSKVIN